MADPEVLAGLPTIMDPDLTEQDRNELEEIRKRLGSEILHWTLLASLLQHEGWKEYEKIIHAGREQVVSLMTSAKPEDMASLQGELKQIQRFQNLRTEIGNNLAELNETMQRVFGKSPERSS